MNKNKKKNKKKGFTLIEILVVVLIIGVLAAIAMPSYMRSVERSRAAGPMTNLGSIAKAQKSYRMGTEHYTDNVGNLDISLTDASNGEDATGSTFEGEFFTYKVYGDDKAVAVATRKNVSADKQYELSIDYGTNQIYCRPITNKTCIDLGLEEGQDYSQVPWTSCEGYQGYNVISCYERDNNGYREEMKCYSDFGGTCFLHFRDENNNVVASNHCSPSQTENGICSSYDSMAELDGLGNSRSCLEINGLECNAWGIWKVMEK